MLLGVSGTFVLGENKIGQGVWSVVSRAEHVRDLSSVLSQKQRPTKRPLGPCMMKALTSF